MHNWRLTDCCDDTRCEKLIVNEARGINCENRRQTFIRRKWKPLYSSLGLLGPRLHTDNTHNTDNTHQTIWWLLAKNYINVIIKMWIWNRDGNNFRWCRTEGENPMDTAYNSILVLNWKRKTQTHKVHQTELSCAPPYQFPSLVRFCSFDHTKASRWWMARDARNCKFWSK